MLLTRAVLIHIKLNCLPCKTGFYYLKQDAYLFSVTENEKRYSQANTSGTGNLLILEKTSLFHDNSISIIMRENQSML